MEIIAHQSVGDRPDFEEGSFLLVKDATQITKPDGQAQVLAMDQKKLFPPHNVHSILARGYWEEYKGEQKVLPGLLVRVEKVVAAE